MSAYTYEYKLPGLVDAPAQVVGEIFEELEKSETGLTPQALVDASRDEEAPLHDEFEWRDDVAAEKYRCDQAAKIIRNVVIVKSQDDEERKAPTRAYVSIPGNEHRYVAVKAALDNAVWKEHLLLTAKREMQQFYGKYRRLDELAGVLDAIAEYLDVG